MVPLLSVGHLHEYLNNYTHWYLQFPLNNTVNNSLYNKQIQVCGNWVFKQQIHLNNEQYNNHLSSDNPSISRLQQSQTIMTNGNTKHNSANNFQLTQWYLLILTKRL